MYKVDFFLPQLSSFCYVMRHTVGKVQNVYRSSYWLYGYDGIKSLEPRILLWQVSDRIFFSEIKSNNMQLNSNLWLANSVHVDTAPIIRSTWASQPKNVSMLKVNCCTRARGTRSTGRAENLLTEDGTLPPGTNFPRWVPQYYFYRRFDLCDINFFYAKNLTGFLSGKKIDNHLKHSSPNRIIYLQ